MTKGHDHHKEAPTHNDEDHGKKDILTYLIVAAVLVAAAYLYYTKAI